MKGSHATSLTEAGVIFGFSCAAQERHPHTHTKLFPSFCWVLLSPQLLLDLAPCFLVGGVTSAAPTLMASQEFVVSLHCDPFSAKIQTLLVLQGKYRKEREKL